MMIVVIIIFFPENWEFPNELSMKQLWTYWYSGNKEEKIPPYRNLNDGNDVNRSNFRKRYSIATKVMKEFSKFIMESKDPIYIPEGMKDFWEITKAKRDEIGALAYEPYVKKVSEAANKTYIPGQDITYDAMHKLIAAAYRRSRRRKLEEEE